MYLAFPSEYLASPSESNDDAYDRRYSADYYNRRQVAFQVQAGLDFILNKHIRIYDISTLEYAQESLTRLLGSSFLWHSSPLYAHHSS